MESYLLKVGQVCVLTLLVALGGVLSIVSYFGLSSWSVLFKDTSDGVIQISHVRVVNEWPIKPDTIKSALNGADLTAHSFEVSVAQNESHNETAVLRDQIKSGLILGGQNLSGDLKGKNFLIYVDVPSKLINSLENAYIYYYSIWSPYELYANGQRLKSSAGRWTYIGASQVPRGDFGSIATRFVWTIKNNFSDKILSFNVRNGLSIRSERAMSLSLENLPIQQEFPHIAASVAFIAIGLIAFSLAATARSYLDVWAFGTFSLTMGLFVWAQTPVFFDGFLESGALLVTIRAVIASSSVVSANILTLAYFRLDGRRWLVGQLKRATLKDLGRSLGRPFLMILLSTIFLCVVVLVSFWPLTANVEIFESTAAINTRLAWILTGSQTLSFVAGIRSLFQARGEFLRDGLLAQARMITRRLLLSLLFALSMSMMLGVYLTSFGAISLDRDSDLVLLAAIFPALAMLLMVFWTIASAQRFYTRFAPRLGQVDQEVMAFGSAALKKRYCAVLYVFDMAGMKKLNRVRNISHAFERVVDSLVAKVEHDLGDLVQKGRITFRYKSNGDEFIFALWAKDPADSRQQFIEIMTLWKKHGVNLLDSWRSDLRDQLSPLKTAGSFDFDIDSIVEKFDMHVLACTMTDVKITVKGGIDTPAAAPDFVDARFTQLSALFKDSFAQKIAIFADDAALLSEQEGYFAPSDIDPTMGFWIIKNRIKKTIAPTAADSESLQNPGTIEPAA